MEEFIDKVAWLMASNQEEEKVRLKVVEECMELCEVLVKSVTKAEEYKPPIEKVIEEMGDLFFRMKVLAKKLLIEARVNERIEEKARQLNAWLKEKEKLNN